MRKLILLNILVASIFSCSNSKSKVDGGLNKSKGEILNCYSKLDTVFSNGDFVKYKTIDTVIDIEVKINSKSTMLGWDLNCNMAEVLVPVCYYHHDNLIILKRGSGTDYREVIVCENLSDSIRINRFETERAEDANKDVFVYKICSDATKIYISKNTTFEDKFNNNMIKTINLPKQYVNLIIEKSTIEDKFILLHFTNDKEYKIPMPKIN